MKVRAYIFATALLAGAVAAQTAPASQTVKQNPPQAQAKKDSTTSKTPAKNPFKPKAKAPESSTKLPVKPQAKAQPGSNKATPKQAAPVQAKAARTKETAKPAEVKKEAAPEVAQIPPKKLPSPGGRDPFVSPLAAAAERGPGAGCTTGKRCLMVDQLVLKGIVQMRTGNFALVENISKRPYVLHENDSLFNGSVVKITGDSVVFREQSNDILGRPVSKEVVKKVSAPAV